MIRALILSALVAATAPAQTPISAAPGPSRLALFKNGYGLVTSRVELSQSGEYEVEPLPGATFGTFWLGWSDTVTLRDIKATQVRHVEAVPAASVAELLEANIGKTVDMLVQNQWQRVTILDVPRVTPGPAPIRPLVELPGPRSDMMIVRDAMGKLALPRSWVQQVRLPEDASLSLERSSLRDVLHFTAAVKAGKPAVTLSYLAPGVAWLPSYVVDISDEKTALLSAKAVLVNDLTDLAETEVELIAGYPQLQFAHVTEAIALSPLEQLLRQLRSGAPDAGAFANTAVIMQQRAEFYRGDRDMPGRPGLPAAPVMGEAAEDLYFHKLGKVTLAKGQRGYFPMYSEKVPYEHRYTWEIPDFIDEENRYQREQTERRQEVVWHAICLTNNTGQPWTTAPGTTTQGGRILGQDTLFFTPAKGQTNLRITQAVSIHADQNEYEVERQRNAAQFYGYHHDLVTAKGELAVTNYKSEAVTVQVVKTLSGEVTQTDAEPKIVKLARGLRRVNPRSQLTWELKVEPGRDKTVTIGYTYQVYVRN